eukprot:4318812-Amphidinium_carterae.1
MAERERPREDCFPSHSKNWPRFEVSGCGQISDDGIKDATQQSVPLLSSRLRGSFRLTGNCEAVLSARQRKS